MRIALILILLATACQAPSEIELGQASSPLNYGDLASQCTLVHICRQNLYACTSGEETFFVTGFVGRHGRPGLYKHQSLDSTVLYQDFLEAATAAHCCYYMALNDPTCADRGDSTSSEPYHTYEDWLNVAR